MKNIFKILICGIFIISLSGCKNNEKINNEKSSYVTYENGEKYTFEELEEIAKENSVAFKEKYCNVPGTITAKLTKITDYKYSAGSKTYIEIWLDGTDSWSNYTANIDYDFYKDLILEMKTGDYLTLTTDKIECTFYTDFSRIEVEDPIVTIAK